MNKAQFKEWVEHMGGIQNSDRVFATAQQKPYWEKRNIVDIYLVYKTPTKGRPQSLIKSHRGTMKNPKVEQSITKYTRWLNEMRNNDK